MFVDKSSAASRAASLWRMAFSFRQIQYFVAAAENGAPFCAARELSISQSTVAERFYHGCYFLSDNVRRGAANGALNRFAGRETQPVSGWMGVASIRPGSAVGYAFVV